MSQPRRSPSVFISYSWDDEDHKRWVRRLAQGLVRRGFELVLDQWHAEPGGHLAEFMERAIRKSTFVLIICTPGYKQRSERKRCGVRYEGDIMRGELLQKGNQRKFVPVLRRGQWPRAAPWWLAGKIYIDLRDGPQKRSQHNKLVATLNRTLALAPSAGSLRMSSVDPIVEKVKAIVAAGGHGGAFHDELRVLWCVHAAGRAGATHERIHNSIFDRESASTTRVLRALNSLAASHLVVAEKRGGVTVYRITEEAEKGLDPVS